MRVLVIGAGLGGLALTRRLRAAGVDVGLRERDPGIEARFQGYRIGLDESGLAALRGCLPERLRPLVDAVAGEVAGMGQVVDTELNPLSENPPTTGDRLFDRNVLRHLLFAGLESSVSFDKQFLDYDRLDNGRVRVRYADGSSESADLLVGADGMGSAVRRQLLPHVQVRELGRFGAIGRTPLDGFTDVIPGWSTVVNAPNAQLMLGKMRFPEPPERAAARLAPEVRLPAPPSYVRWVMMLPASAESGDQAGSQLVPLLRLTETWHPRLRELLASADLENSSVGPLRIGDPVPPWPSGAVTLIGDAAHPVPPGGGGAGLALLDAESLATAVLEGAVAECERDVRTRGAASRAQAVQAFRWFDELQQGA